MAMGPLLWKMSVSAPEWAATGGGGAGRSVCRKAARVGKIMLWVVYFDV